MADSDDISRDVQALIARDIDSVVQLELLLLLHDEPARAWSAEEVARELRIESLWTAAQIRQLVARRLVQVVDEKAGTYRYSPTSGDVAATIDRLSRAYTDRRVRVIALIYAKPADTLRTFADAFRFRRDDKNG